MKSTNPVLVYLRHYFRGAAASGWNAGWIAVSAGVSQSSAASFGAKIPLPTPATVFWTFVGAALIANVLYFKANPLPVETPKPTAADPSKAAGASLPAASIAAVMLIGCLMLSGCIGQIPTNSAESATYSLNVGPFFSQSATFDGISKTPNGVMKIGNFDGKTSYLGIFNTEQTAHDLVIGGNTTITADPVQPATPSATPSASAPATPSATIPMAAPAPASRFPVPPR